MSAIRASVLLDWLDRTRPNLRLVEQAVVVHEALTLYAPLT